MSDLCTSRSTIFDAAVVHLDSKMSPRNVEEGMTTRQEPPSSCVCAQDSHFVFSPHPSDVEVELWVALGRWGTFGSPGHGNSEHQAQLKMLQKGNSVPTFSPLVDGLQGVMDCLTKRLEIDSTAH